MSSNTVEKNRPDLSYIKITLQKIKKYLQKDQLFILESTSYPGTTEEEILEPLKKNLKLEKIFI